MSQQTAAFFRAEGVLLSTGVMHAAAFMAAQRPGMRERAFRFGQVALSVPVFGLLGQNDRTLANRVAHMAYRDMFDDRVAIVAEEYVEDVLKEKLLDRGKDLIRDAKRAGHRIVVISEMISEIMDPLRDHLKGIDDLICNHLEYRDHKASGRLEEPVIGGHEGGRWLQDYARQHEIDLERSIAYAGHGPDLLLLSAVGKPCVVNPDFTLRKAAKAAEWPVLEYTA